MSATASPRAGGRSSALRLGTRSSALALAQSGLVAERVRDKSGREIELVHISTRGDQSHTPITELVNPSGGGGTGVFVSALRHALLDHEVDFVVHSFKDLPTAAEPAIALAAVPTREDPADVLISRDNLTFAQLPAGARIGTGAPRRIAQILAARPDVVCVPVRGNVDTRMQRVADGDLDAVVLARAGLARLDRLAEVSDVFSFDVLLPAPAQGALAVECRDGDAELAEVLSVLDDEATRVAVTAERALLATLEAGCAAPVGAYAEICEIFGEAHLHLYGAVIAGDGTQAIRRSESIPLHAAVQGAASLGERVAVALKDAGAAALMGVNA